MNTIKFSHNFLKLQGLPADRQVVLLDISLTHMDALSKQFLLFDTEYLTPELFIERYPLDAKNDYILLLFGAVNKFQFIIPTLRRHTPEKWDFYKSKIGEYFTVKIEA